MERALNGLWCRDRVVQVRYAVCEVPTIGPAKQYQPLHPEIVEPELDNARVTENPPEPRHVRELP